MTRFLRTEFELTTPMLHNTQFISGHYFLRYLNHHPRSLGILAAQEKWDHSDKSDFFAPYTLPAHFHYEQYNGVSRIAPYTPFFFKSRKLYTLENVLLMDILDPTSAQLEDFQETIRTTGEFQFGGKEAEGYGICRYKSATFYDYNCTIPSSNEFLIEFMGDFIPRKKSRSKDIIHHILTRLSPVLPPDYHLQARSIPMMETKRYYIKKDMEFEVIPQFFMMHLQTNYPEYNKYLAQCGIQGLGKLGNAGLGKFRLRNPGISPLAHHGTYRPSVATFSEEEKQFLKAVLLHDLVPKVGGIEFLTEYYTKKQNLSGLLLKLHYNWHELRQKTTIRLSEFLHDIEVTHGNQVARWYYKLALADQLAAMLTRVKRVPTFSRYLVGHDYTQRIDLLGLTHSLLSIESPFKLWTIVIRSPELALLNEALAYGDQPLSTHLLLSLNFATYLMRDRTAFVLAKLVPQNEKTFIQGFWYKIFNITQNKEVFIYVIEEQIPEYPAAMVKTLLVKSIRPETSWLRIQ
ncbi:MAG TPA: hypothetical protein VMV49_12570 [Candidatus Deferrimicrobium sp.]|nr:hypothetical protein [Candidatus Deferrimicrobium sp.]